MVKMSKSIKIISKYYKYPMLRSNYKSRSLSLALTFFCLNMATKRPHSKRWRHQGGSKFTCGGKRAKTRSAYRRYGFSCPRSAALNPKTVSSLPLSSLRGVSVCARIQDRASPRRRSRKCRFGLFARASFAATDSFRFRLVKNKYLICSQERARRGRG
jgi:hypothetical protein